MVEGAGDAESAVRGSVSELVEERLKVALPQSGDMLGSLHSNDQHLLQRHPLSGDNVLQLAHLIHGQPKRVFLSVHVTPLVEYGLARHVHLPQANEALLRELTESLYIFKTSWDWNVHFSFYPLVELLEVDRCSVLLVPETA